MSDQIAALAKLLDKMYEASNENFDAGSGRGGMTIEQEAAWLVARNVVVDPMALTAEESDVIRREIRDGTPNTPQRVETMRRADEAYARSFGGPASPLRGPPEGPTLNAVLEWLKARPGVSWQATVDDIEAALNALTARQAGT